MVGVGTGGGVGGGLDGGRGGGRRLNVEVVAVLFKGLVGGGGSGFHGPKVSAGGGRWLAGGGRGRGQGLGEGGMILEHSTSRKFDKSQWNQIWKKIMGGYKRTEY